MIDRACKILLVEDNPVNARLVQQMLKDAEGGSFEVTHIECLVKALDVLANNRFDLGLVDLSLPDSEGLETFLAIKRHAPGLPVVVLTGCDNESLAMRAVEEGAQDYLVKGKIRSVDLARAVQYGIIRGRKLTIEPVSLERAEIVAFLGSKGGVGTTTLACHAAHCLKRHANEKILLCGLDVHSAAIGLFMKVESEYTVADAAMNLHRLDANLWRGFVCPTSGQIDVLLPPSTFQLTEPLTAERVRHVLRFARSLYRWIVIDLGTVNPVSLGMLEEVKALYVVTTHDLPALWHAARMLKCMVKAGVAPAQIRLLANRANKHNSLSRNDLTKALGFEIHAVLPDDSETMEHAMADGRFVDPNSRLYNEVSRFVGKMLGTEIPADQSFRRLKRFMRA